MELSTINAVIGQLRPQLNEKVAIWLYPHIPEEIIEYHRSAYLSLNEGETPLIIINRKQMMFTGLCITNQRLILRLEGKVGFASEISRKTIEFPLDSIQSLSCLQNMDNSIRVLVNNKNIGYIYPMQAEQEKGFKISFKDDFSDIYYACIESLFNALSGVATENANTSSDETLTQTINNVVETEPTVVQAKPSYRESDTKSKHNKISGFISTYFVDAIKSHYADFKGKASRSEYWYYILCQFLILSGICGICELTFHGGLMVYLILCPVLFLPSLAIGVRRLHDIGKSGWMLLIVLIPLIGSIWLLVLMCKKGETKPRHNNFLPIDYIILLVSVIFGFLWYDQTINNSSNYTDLYSSESLVMNDFGKKSKGQWYLIDETAAVPDCEWNRIYGIGSNSKKDIGSDELGYYGEPAIIYSECDGKEKWRVLLKFSEISENYQDMFMDLIPASFDSNVLYFNYNFNGEDGCGYSGKVDTTTGKFDLFKGRIIGMITEGTYKDMYLKDMDSYWGIYQQSVIGESGSPQLELSPALFQSMSEDDVISCIEKL